VIGASDSFFGASEETPVLPSVDATLDFILFSSFVEEAVFKIKYYFLNKTHLKEPTLQRFLQ
jgi:hypothetical protein